MICSSQMIDLEMDQRGQGYLHPEPCIFLGGVTGFPHPDIQTVMTAARNTSNIDAHHLPEHYEGAMFYGIPQYHGVQHHHAASNLDLSVGSASNFYVPYMPTHLSGVPINHGSPDQLPSSSSFGVVGVASDEYERNTHFMDHGRGSYKRKNSEGIPGNSQSFSTLAASTSSFTPLNMRHPDGPAAATDGASFTLPQYRGSGAPIREVVSQRSVRNRSGSTAIDPVLAQSHNSFVQGNYMGQQFSQSSPLWLDQQLSNNRNDGGPSVWSQAPALPYIQGNNVSVGSVETGNMNAPRYHETSSNRNSTAYLHPSQLNLRHHTFNHHSAPAIQGVRGHTNQVAATSYRVPASYAPRGMMNPSQNNLEMGPRHLGPLQPTGFRIYQPHRDGFVHDTTLRHHNLPHLRVMPTDGVALLEIPDIYDVGNYVDHHRDMRLDIENMSYEELLALGERIGNVNTGLSEETVQSRLKTRIYLSCAINLEEAPAMDQEHDSCIICQENYKNQEKIGSLECGHEYHEDCLKKWLFVKNVCPICKSEAVATEKKDV